MSRNFRPTRKAFRRVGFEMCHSTHTDKTSAWTGAVLIVLLALCVGCAAWAPLHPLGLQDSTEATAVDTGRTTSQGAVGLDPRARGIERSLGVVR